MGKQGIYNKLAGWKTSTSIEAFCVHVKSKIVNELECSSI